jgi:hypothetical protein
MTDLFEGDSPKVIAEKLKMLELFADTFPPQPSEEGNRQRQLYAADLAKAQQLLDDVDDTLGKSGR